MYDIILSFITAFMVTYFAIPSIIQVARVKHLVDEPGERRSHKVSTPSLGGIGIFGGVIFAIIMWMPFKETYGGLQYILASFVVIFLIGAKDDIVPTTPVKKLVGQIFAAFILVAKTDIKITDFHGIVGIHELPEWFAFAFSIFTILVIINAFNLIDGINGLAGGIAILISATFGIWFLMVDRMDMAIIAFSTIGAVVAFLNYNLQATIFMGDTGSLLLGLICSILALNFIEHNIGLEHPLAVQSVPAVTMGILILPLFDTLRVFTTRIMKGKSPLYPDRTHIHHLLLDTGLSHLSASAVLVIVNILFIGLVYQYQHLGSLPLIIILFAIAGIASGTLYLYVSRKKKSEIQIR